MAVIANAQQRRFVINRIVKIVIADKAPPFQIFIIK